MDPTDIPRMRSRALALGGSRFEAPADVVAWLGAVQSQEYLPAQWSLSQRAPGLTQADVERALEEGSIIRTHALRPTWQFLAREDARWILGLTGPRVQSSTAGVFRRLELDTPLLGRAERALIKALQGENRLTRAELGEALTKNRIDVTGQRLPWILMHCEFEQVICSGGRRGNVPTYAAFDEVVPSSRPLDRETAMRELVRRYLQSHGPATVYDLSWWASLKVVDIRKAIVDLDDEIEATMVDGLELWSLDGPRSSGSGGGVRLLETFDEYIVGYTRSRFIGDPRGEAANKEWKSGPYRNIVTKNGSILGHWNRRKKGPAVAIEVSTYEPLSDRDLKSLRAEAKRYGSFFGLEVTLKLS